MKLRNFLVLAASALFAAPVFADIVQLTFPSPGVSSGASWTGALPPGCCIIDNSTGGVGSPVSIRWGNETVKSGYDFTLETPPIDLDTTVTTPVLIGTFDHLNFPITGTFLASVELDIIADVSISNGGPFVDQGLKTFKFDFTHDETPNTPPCPVGTPTQNTPPCADLVTVSPNVDSATFLIGSVQYTLDIVGFSQDGGSTIANQFITIENQENKAGLYAIVRTTTQQVPEPASLALLGLGLLAAGFVRRKSNR